MDKSKTKMGTGLAAWLVGNKEEVVYKLDNHATVFQLELLP